MPTPTMIHTTFSVRGEEVHRFQSELKKSVGDGTREQMGDTTADMGDSVDDKFDYRFTGRHDHGVLPALQSGGPHGELVQALLDAKADGDKFLTDLIAREQSRGGKGLLGEQLQQTTETNSASTERQGETLSYGESGGTRASVRDDGKTQPAPPSTQPAKRPRP